MIGGALLKFATSRVGIVVMIFAALFAWHRFDRGSAVRDAVMRYVADVELSAAEAEAKALREQADKLRAANDALLAQIEADNRNDENAEQTNREFLESTPAPSDGLVSDGLADLLRSN